MWNEILEAKNFSKTPKSEIVNLIENYVSNGNGVLIEQIMKDAFRDAFIIEGEDLQEVYNIYLNQIAENKIDIELEKAIDETVTPFIVNTFESYGKFLDFEPNEVSLTESQIVTETFDILVNISK